MDCFFFFFFAFYRKKLHIPEHKENFLHPLLWEKSIFWHNSVDVATINQPTHILLSRYTAGFISDNNSRWIFSEVKKYQNITPFNSYVHNILHSSTATARPWLHCSSTVVLKRVTWAKVGAKIFYPRVKSQISLSDVQEINISWADSILAVKHQKS